MQKRYVFGHAMPVVSVSERSIKTTYFTRTAEGFSSKEIKHGKKDLP
ncbi:hypothetical protein Barb6_03638 [Bacteroidales bacterium Barb6]|nr:hypothetical protein Barb6_03638 [Bacteroidales bacterium Barb6]